jgi:hypothetical protein
MKSLIGFANQNSVDCVKRFNSDVPESYVSKTI